MHYINEVFGFAVALAIGLYALRYMNFYYRLFFIQLLVFTVFFFLSYGVITYDRANNLKLNDQWVFNISMLLESGILMFAASKYFKNRIEKKMVWFGYSLFIVVFIFELRTKGISSFANHSYIVGGLIILISYLFMIYLEFVRKNSNWKHSVDLWIYTGIVLYFAGIVPYLSLLHYLDNQHPKISLVLYYVIVIGLSHFRYIFLAIGFWVIRRNALMQKGTSNE